MLCIKSADIIGFVEPGTLQSIMDGDVGFELTPAIILMFSLLQMLPILMILGARVLGRGINRWLNIVVAVLTLLYVLGGGNWSGTSYYVFAIVEVVAMAVIVWQAWTWKE